MDGVWKAATGLVRKQFKEDLPEMLLKASEEESVLSVVFTYSNI